jgi:hypothetical protein
MSQVNTTTANTNSSAKNWWLQFLYTDWGQFVVDHWRGAVFVVGFFTMVAVGYGVFGHFKGKSIESEQQKVYLFLKDWTKTNPVEEETKIVSTTPEDWSKATSFFDSLDNPQVAISVIVELLKRSRPVPQGQEAAALAFFQHVAERCDKSSLCFYYAQLKVAAISEDMGQLAQAEASLKGLISTPWKNEEQIYVDLTRVAFLKKSPADVKSYGEYFLKQFPNSNQVGLINYFVKESALSK